MSRTLIRLGLLIGFLLLPLAASLSTVRAAPARSEVVGFDYVNLNTTPNNSIGGFARHQDGSLSPLSGSPFAAGGTGKPAPSAGSLQQTTDGKYLLVADPGSNQVSVLRTHEDGSLSQVGSPISSGGTLPVSITIHRNLVYVANAGAGGSNYTGFTFNDGSLTPIAGSTVSLPDGSNPGQVLFNESGRTLIATEIGTTTGTSFIDSYTVKHDGTLGLASHLAGQGTGSFGSAFRPTTDNQLFVSNAHNGANLGTVSAFKVASDGTLSSIGASPYADHQTAPCWVAITPDGRFLFAVNTAVGSISRYHIEGSGELKLLGSTAANDSSGLGPVDAAVSPNGEELYVTDSGADAVSAFRIHEGDLIEFAGSPIALPAGNSAKPIGIVVTGRQLRVSSH